MASLHISRTVDAVKPEHEVQGAPTSSQDVSPTARLLPRQQRGTGEVIHAAALHANCHLAATIRRSSCTRISQERSLNSASPGSPAADNLLHALPLGVQRGFEAARLAESGLNRLLPVPSPSYGGSQSLGTSS